jgi:alpha-1,2-glucosyltransferase
MCLGHKELHKPVLHLPQLLYFLAFVSVLLLPSLLVEGVGRTLRGALRLGLGSSR